MHVSMESGVTLSAYMGMSRARCNIVLAMSDNRSGQAVSTPLTVDQARSLAEDLGRMADAQDARPQTVQAGSGIVA